MNINKKNLERVEKIDDSEEIVVVDDSDELSDEETGALMRACLEGFMKAFEIATLHSVEITEEENTEEEN